MSTPNVSYLIELGVLPSDMSVELANFAETITPPFSPACFPKPNVNVNLTESPEERKAFESFKLRGAKRGDKPGVFVTKFGINYDVDDSFYFLEQLVVLKKARV